MQIKTVYLKGKISICDLYRVAAEGYRVEFSPEYLDRVERGRKLTEKIADSGEAVYGITTGLGDNSAMQIPVDKRRQLQLNTIRSHACSVGALLDKKAVRAMMFVMLVHLGTGYSGISTEPLLLLKNMLNCGLTPAVPKNGSVGYLCAEAHIALALVGEGRFQNGGGTLIAEKALAKKGLTPCILKEKEGLSLISGTTSVTAFAALACAEMERIVFSADIISAMSCELLSADCTSFDNRLMELRPHPHQKQTAANLRDLLTGGTLEVPMGRHPTNALSLTCIPQVHGAVKKILADAVDTITIELNSTVDTPVVFEINNRAITLTGCNSDGSYCGMAADTLCMAIVSLVKMSERRLDRLVNSHFNCFPPFLSPSPGLNSGLMIPQYSAAGILGQLRCMVYPASADSVPTSAGHEDYVSMGYNAALKAYEMMALARYIPAIELLNVRQARAFATAGKSTPAIEEVFKQICKGIPFFEEDKCMSGYIEWLANKIEDNSLIVVVEKILGRSLKS